MTLKQLGICTLKKTASVFGEIGAGILFFGSTILASAIVGLILAGLLIEIVKIYNASTDLFSPMMTIVLSGISRLISISFFGIPLWTILLIPVSVVAYSFLWCVNRDLTEEDMKCKESYFFLIALSTLLSGVVGCIFEVEYLVQHAGDFMGVVYATAILLSGPIFGYGVVLCIPLYHHYFKRPRS